MTDDSQKSPLDVLEEILSQNRASDDPNNPAGQAADPAATQEAIEAQQLAEVQAQYQEQLAVDQTQIQAQLKQLEEIKQMPQYQARLDQEEKTVEIQEQYEQKMEGTEIIQIEHTKIPDPQGSGE